jgi:hypothetical protein
MHAGDSCWMPTHVSQYAATHSSIPTHIQQYEVCLAYACGRLLLDADTYIAVCGHINSGMRTYM